MGHPARFAVEMPPGGDMTLLNASCLERTSYHEAGHVAAALTFGVPIIAATIVDEPAMHRGRYHPPAGLGVEPIVVLCLAGPAAERLFCGSTPPGSDRTDRVMARSYLMQVYAPARVSIELVRYCDAADRLVAEPWAKARIPVIAAALRQYGTLTGDDLLAIVAEAGSLASPLVRYSELGAG
jgi:hypothetical protein